MTKKLIIILLLFNSCVSNSSYEKRTYPEAVGNIEYNNKIDGHFIRCGFIPMDTLTSFRNSYYGLIGWQYEGEMYAIKKHFEEHFKSIDSNGESGYIVVRFVVNCEGQSGMYRVSEMDLSLKKRSFDKTISDQIIKLVKELKGWKAIDYDYHHYLSFKFMNGNIIDISP